MQILEYKNKYKCNQVSGQLVLTAASKQTLRIKPFESEPAIALKKIATS